MEFNEKLTIEEWTGHNELAISIFNNKYKNGDETFMQTIDRIAGGNEKIKQLILEKKFLPGGRICANRGLDHDGRKVSLSNCYVMTPPEDDLSSIFDTAKELAITFSRGGGCGVDVSKLAYNGAKVNNAAKESSGAVSFMELYSMVTGLIAQRGRRGALMISLDINHPDIEEFITVKNDLDKITKANISVKITDEFMQAVKDDGDFTLYFKREETNDECKKVVKARDLFRLICKNAWNMAEPGVLFWDRISKYNILSEDKKFELAGTNPCSEIPLPAGGACLLGSLNLAEFVKKERNNKSKYFDFIEFEKAIRLVVKELNVVLDEGIPLHPLKVQQDAAKKWRAIGIGVMGIADMLIKLETTYGNQESLALCDSISGFMAQIALNESAKLAEKYGKFPACNKKSILDSEFVKNNADEYTKKLIAKCGLRNGQLLTIAPTGSLSNVLGVSGGIEPIFATSYTRKTESLHNQDIYYKVYTPIVEEYMKNHPEIENDESKLPEYFITSQDIPYENRIKIQSVWQQHIDNAISSTVNLPEETTVEEVEDLYMKAWENGLKGITIFRDNCVRVGVLTTNTKDTNGEIESSEEETIGLARGEVQKITNNVIGLKRKLMTGCGSLHCVAMFDRDTGKMVETYLSKGSTGGCNNFMVGLSRMISLSARLGASIESIIDQLKSTGSCPSYAVRKATHNDTSLGSCCPMAVGNALIDMYNEYNHLGKYASDSSEPLKEVSSKEVNNKVFEYNENSLCPQCGDKLEHEGGCDICKSCGWTKCD